MRKVGLKVLKNKLSEYVRAAAGGETVLVTDRNRVVAEIAPHRPKRGEPGAEERYAEAVRAGWITRAPRAARIVPGAIPSSKLGQLMEELEQDRADR